MKPYDWTKPKRQPAEQQYRQQSAEARSDLIFAALIAFAAAALVIVVAWPDFYLWLRKG